MRIRIFTRKTDFFVGELKITEFLFEVPENYAKPKDGLLRLFARSAEKVEKPADQAKAEKKQLPWCTSLSANADTSMLTTFAVLFLRGVRYHELSKTCLTGAMIEGGPGFGCGSPQVPWTSIVLNRGYKACSPGIEAVDIC